MKTPDQIQQVIDTLPESKRKRALVELARKGVNANNFWNEVQRGDYGKVAAWLDGHDLQVYADAVWEG